MTTYRQYQDTRDGHIYNCVQMPDGKWWFAKNLSYASANSLVYNNDSANEAIYGRLYPWDDLASACPPGCHIPTDAEWTALTTAIGGDVAGTKLKANSTLWSTNTGTDDYGFSVLPAGRYYDGAFYDLGGVGAFYDLGDVAYIWSSSKYDVSSAWYRYFDCDNVYRYSNDRVCGYSLRCIVGVSEPIPKPPNFFPPPGTYDNPIIVTLNKSGMRYTLDGTDPAETSPFLDIPLRISGPTEIRLKSDAMPTVYSFAYLIKGRALPMYKQAALWADGDTSPESITRTYHG